MKNEKLKAQEARITPAEFTSELVKNDLGPIIEVPCSYLTHWLNYLWDSEAIEVINPANEAIAMGIAAGEYAGSGKIPIIAVQNSGFMNSLNALTSLHQIYEIPAFMMVTWRGEGGTGKDAPEHDITGENLLSYMKTFNLSYEVLSGTDYANQIKRLGQKAKKSKKPVVLIVRKDTFEEYKTKKPKTKNESLEMTRLDAIKAIKEEMQDRAIFVSGTGYPSRDSFSAQDTPDFYIMGSMGHAFAFALGVSPHTKKKVVVFDGDGGALMHAGAFSSLDPKIHKNIIYVCLDNQVYESTGGQPTVSCNVDFKKLGEAFGFPRVETIKNSSKLKSAIQSAIRTETSTFLHVRIKTGGHSQSKRVSDVHTAPEITDRFSKKFNK